MNATATSMAGARTSRLLAFLEQDPSNLSLLADAAASALDDGDPQTTDRLVRRYAEIAEPPAALRNLAALAAIEGARFEEAAAILSDLIDRGSDDPAVRFNLAWSRAMLGEFQAVADLLSDPAAAGLPRAAALRVEALHHLGRFDEALEWGAAAAERNPEDAALGSALAVAALDAERPDLARDWAERSGGSPDGEAVLGMVSLAEHDVATSIAHFDRALAADAGNARAQLGKGLGLLALDQPEAGAEALDQAAEAFGDHLGSWLAAGWARFVQGDYAGARSRFEHSMALDDTFAENHGSLAVLDVIDGDLDGAQRRIDIAVRLDRDCFSAALARSLLLAAQGDAEAAARVRDIAFNTPIDQTGMTIAKALVGLGALGRKP